MSEKGGAYRVVTFIVIFACLLAAGMILYEGWDRVQIRRGASAELPDAQEADEGTDATGAEDYASGPALPSGAVDYASALPPIADIAEAISPAVVRIDVVKKVSQSPLGGQGMFEDFFRNFGDMEYEQEGSGSGFILSSDGYIVTNHHVVEDMDEIKVTLLDGRSYDAELVGSYAAYDVAVVKVDANDLPYAVLGDSSDLRPGEWVVAIGNPHGFDHTVTAGIVSAIDRNLANVDGAEDISQAELIQTDAAINSGNSGGPLLDMDGKVVGINTAIIPYAQGISFAVSIDSVKEAIQSLKSTGKYARPWIGIWYYALNAEAAAELKISETSGLYVAEVAEGGPAEKAGIKKGDVIKQFNGKSATGQFNLSQEVRALEIGDKVRVGIVRGSKSIEIAVTLGETPEE